MPEVYTPLSFIDQYIINHSDSLNIRTNRGHHSKSADPSELALPFVCFDAGKKYFFYYLGGNDIYLPISGPLFITYNRSMVSSTNRKTYLQEYALN